MLTIEIEQITIPYNKELLTRWKARDPSIVPNFMLGWNGPGISNGYGFGEWISEQFFRDNGYYVFANEFDLLSTKTKFKRYNEMITTIIGENRLINFKDAFSDTLKSGKKIENPDLFVYNLKTCFFVEVKKEKDKIREPQILYFYLVKECLEVESKLVYLCDKSNEVKFEKLIFELDI